MTTSDNESRNYAGPEKDARLLVTQCDKRSCSVPTAQRICADGGEACGLASCPLCRSRWAQEAAAAVVESCAHLPKVQWVTITPLIGKVELDHVEEFNVTRFKEKIARKLRTALPDGTKVFGALDVSLNLHENAEKHLQFHYHAFIWPPLNKKEQQSCSNLFERDREQIGRPSHFQMLGGDGVAGTAPYTFKWFYQRRSTFDPITYDDEIQIRPKAKKQSLQAIERVAIHNALMNYRVNDLLFLMGLKRKRSRDPFNLSLTNFYRYVVNSHSCCWG